MRALTEPRRSFSVLAWAFLLVGVALVVAACGPSASGPEEQAGGGDVLGFEASILGGGTLDGDTLAGQPVLLWFWAPT